MTKEIYKDVLNNVYDYEVYDNGEKKGYYIIKNGRKNIDQYNEFIPFPAKTIEESAILHIKYIIDEIEFYERSKITFDTLMSEINTLKTENETLKATNAEQDALIAELVMI